MQFDGFLKNKVKQDINIFLNFLNVNFVLLFFSVFLYNFGIKCI